MSFDELGTDGHLLKLSFFDLPRFLLFFAIFRMKDGRSSVALNLVMLGSIMAHSSDFGLACVSYSCVVVLTSDGLEARRSGLRPLAEGSLVGFLLLLFLCALFPTYCRLGSSIILRNRS
jgi:hypothetical protein